jgi:hypothetical protein
VVFLVRAPGRATGQRDGSGANHGEAATQPQWSAGAPSKVMEAGSLSDVAAAIRSA